VITDENDIFDSAFFAHLPAGILTGDETDVFNADLAVPLFDIFAIGLAGGGFPLLGDGALAGPAGPAS
jgi:hypothetical protein